MIIIEIIAQPERPEGLHCPRCIGLYFHSPFQNLKQGFKLTTCFQRHHITKLCLILIGIYQCIVTNSNANTNDQYSTAGPNGNRKYLHH